MTAKRVPPSGYFDGTGDLLAQLDSSPPGSAQTVNSAELTPQTLFDEPLAAIPFVVGQRLTLIGSVLYSHAAGTTGFLLLLELLRPDATVVVVDSLGLTEGPATVKDQDELVQFGSVTIDQAGIWRIRARAGRTGTDATLGAYRFQVQLFDSLVLPS